MNQLWYIYIHLLYILSHPGLSQDVEYSPVSTGRSCHSLRRCLVWCVQPAGCVGQRMAFPFQRGGRFAGAKDPVKYHRCDERRGVESTSPEPAPHRWPEVLAVSVRTQRNRCRGHSCEFPGNLLLPRGPQGPAYPWDELFHHRRLEGSASLGCHA